MQQQVTETDVSSEGRQISLPPPAKAQYPAAQNHGERGAPPQLEGAPAF